MIEILVCYVLVAANGVAAPVETEQCYNVETSQTLNAYCQFVGGFAWGSDHKVTFCRLARGRTRPEQEIYEVPGQ